jgi:hypothetical protein
MEEVRPSKKRRRSIPLDVVPKTTQKPRTLPQRGEETEGKIPKQNLEETTCVIKDGTFGTGRKGRGVGTGDLLGWLKFTPQANLEQCSEPKGLSFGL